MWLIEQKLQNIAFQEIIVGAKYLVESFSNNGYRELKMNLGEYGILITGSEEQELL